MNEFGERTPETTEPAVLAAVEVRPSETGLPAGKGDRRSTGPLEQHTEAGDWQAIWMFDHVLIRILLVRNISDGTELIRADKPTAPDLAQLRDQFPHLSPLWDAVRHQFWTESLCPGTHPQPSPDV